MRYVQLETEAAALKAAAYKLGDLLAEKCVAYGGAHNRQVDIWAAVLKQYEEERDGVAGYWLPDALIYHIPRLTRIFDRIMRIVSNPAADHLGEDPWRDLAGDALAGVVMPKPPVSGYLCSDPKCERKDCDGNPHMSFDAAGIQRWTDHEPPSLLGMHNPAGFDPAQDT